MLRVSVFDVACRDVAAAECRARERTHARDVAVFFIEDRHLVTGFVSRQSTPCAIGQNTRQYACAPLTSNHRMSGVPPIDRHGGLSRNTWGWRVGGFRVITKISDVTF